MRRLLLRILRILVAVVVIAEALYLIAANAWLRSGRLDALVNSNPGKLMIHWGSAWTPWPGSIHMKDVTIRGRSAIIDWYAHVDSISASHRTWPLTRRIVSLRQVSASGIDYRQRRRLLPGSLEIPEADLPPMPSLPAQQGAATPPAAAGASGPPWTIAADRIDGIVTQLWFDQYRISSPMTVRISMNLVVRGPLEFPEVRLRLERGDLLSGQEPIFEGLSLTYRSGYIPGILGVLLVIAGLGHLAYCLGPYLYPGVSLGLVMLTFLGDLAFMLWLLVRGWRIQEPAGA